MPSSSRNAHREDHLLLTYRRSLQGIEGEHRTGEDPPIEPSVPEGMGPIVSSYLVAHGYNQAAIDFIVAAFNCRVSERDFIASLASKGIAICEAKWMHQAAMQ